MLTFTETAVKLWNSYYNWHKTEADSYVRMLLLCLRLGTTRKLDPRYDRSGSDPRSIVILFGNQGPRTFLENILGCDRSRIQIPKSSLKSNFWLQTKPTHRKQWPKFRSKRDSFVWIEQMCMEKRLKSSYDIHWSKNFQQEKCGRTYPSLHWATEKTMTNIKIGVGSIIIAVILGAGYVIMFFSIIIKSSHHLDSADMGDYVHMEAQLERTMKEAGLMQSKLADLKKQLTEAQSSAELMKKQAADSTKQTVKSKVSRPGVIILGMHRSGKVLCPIVWVPHLPLARIIIGQMNYELIIRTFDIISHC